MNTSWTVDDSALIWSDLQWVFGCISSILALALLTLIPLSVPAAPTAIVDVSVWNNRVNGGYNFHYWSTRDEVIILQDAKWLPSSPFPCSLTLWSCMNSKRWRVMKIHGEAFVLSQGIALIYDAYPWKGITRSHLVPLCCIEIAPRG